MFPESRGVAVTIPGQFDGQAKVVGLGEALFDCFEGRTVLGGAPVNLAVHAQQLLAGTGGRGVVVSRVGHDSLGKRLIAELDDRGLETSCIQQDATFPTGRVNVVVADDGQPEYSIEENVAWDHLEMDASLERLAECCAAVCFGTLAQRSEPSCSTIQHFLALAKNAIRMLDVNLRQTFYTAETIVRSLQAATALKLSEDELAQVTRLVDPGKEQTRPDDAARMLSDRFRLNLLALTRGADGTVIYCDGRRFEGEPASYPRQPEADSVGAGDACCAGVVYGMMMAWPPEKTLALANRLGAYVASRKGATPTLPAELLP